MKITVLDGFALNPGDLSWEDFQALGETTIHERTAGSQVLERSEGAEVLLTNKTPLRREVLEQLPKLKYIGVLATGYNVVDVESAKERGIIVTNVPSYSTESVAQMVFALLLELARRTGHHSDEVHRGRWTASPDFCFWDTPQIELAEKTLGIVGFGRIGRAVARIAHAFGMRVLATSRTMTEPPEFPGFEWRDLDGLFRESDVVSLHCPLLPTTEGLVNRKRLALMKRGSFLINTSRGGLVVEEDLAAVLEEGRIAGAGIDVASSEPPGREWPLRGAGNLVVTPHLAWATKEARERLMQIAVENLQSYLKGTPKNLV